MSVTRSAKGYLMEANQKLNGGIAEQMLSEVKPLVDGRVDTNAIQDIMHSMMVINPSVEVYLLDQSGGIITYVVPYKKVVRDQVALGPIHDFIDSREDMTGYILGDDPRKTDGQNVFSACALKENDVVSGYLYIILAGQEQYAVLSDVFGSYFLSTGLIYFAIALLVGLLIGGILLWRLMKDLRVMTSSVESFQEGDLSARIDMDEVSDLCDISHTFNEMADSVEKNINATKELDQFRKELIANVSHDLRTPLAVIRGYTETMMMKGDDMTRQQRDHYLELINKSSLNLNKLIGQLFELSKLEAKSTPLHKEKFVLTDLLSDVVQKFDVLAQSHNIEVSLSIDGDIPLIYGDIAMVERVFQNLIDNALQHTEPGGRVDIQVRNAANKIECVVSDTGVGMSQEETEIVFERFQRGTRSSETAVKEGAGLGLAIVKRILTLHESSIRVTSRLNHGTQFIFHLPTV